MGGIYGQTITRRHRRATYYKPPTGKPEGAITSGNNAYKPSNAKKRPKRREEAIQIRVCNYLRSNYPDVIFISDNAAGADLSNTARINMMKMRSHEGMADLLILEASRGYNALALELKDEGVKIYKKDGKTLRKASYRRRYMRGGKPFYKTGDHLQEQADMIARYRSKNIMACFAIGFDDTCSKIDRYLNRQQDLGLF